MDRSFDYAVVVPVYNAEATLLQLFDRTKAVFTEIDSAFQIVLVDDNSADQSWRVLNELKDKFPENITITENAIIPLKERVVDRYYDPLKKLFRKSNNK